MTMLSDFNNSREAMIDAANQYITLLMGFASAPDTGEDIITEDEGEDDEDGKKDSDAVDEEAPEPGASDITEKTKKDRKESRRARREKKKKASLEDSKKAYSLRRLIQFTWTNSLDVKHKSPM